MSHAKSNLTPPILGVSRMYITEKKSEPCTEIAPQFLPSGAKLLQSLAENFKTDISNNTPLWAGTLGSDIWKLGEWYVASVFPTLERGAADGAPPEAGLYWAKIVSVNERLQQTERASGVRHSSRQATQILGVQYVVQRYGTRIDVADVNELRRKTVPKWPENDQWPLMRDEYGKWRGLPPGDELANDAGVEIPLMGESYYQDRFGQWGNSEQLLSRDDLQRQMPRWFKMKEFIMWANHDPVRGRDPQGLFSRTWDQEFEGLGYAVDLSRASLISCLFRKSRPGQGGSSVAEEDEEEDIVVMVSDDAEAVAAAPAAASGAAGTAAERGDIFRSEFTREGNCIIKDSGNVKGVLINGKAPYAVLNILKQHYEGFMAKVKRMKVRSSTAWSEFGSMQRNNNIDIAKQLQNQILDECRTKLKTKWESYLPASKSPFEKMIRAEVMTAKKWSEKSIDDSTKQGRQRLNILTKSVAKLLKTGPLTLDGVYDKYMPHMKKRNTMICNCFKTKIFGFKDKKRSVLSPVKGSAAGDHMIEAAGYKPYIGFDWAWNTIPCNSWENTHWKKFPVEWDKFGDYTEHIDIGKQHLTTSELQFYQDMSELEIKWAEHWTQYNLPEAHWVPRNFDAEIPKLKRWITSQAQGLEDDAFLKVGELTASLTPKSAATAWKNPLGLVEFGTWPLKDGEADRCIINWQCVAKPANWHDSSHGTWKLGHLRTRAMKLNLDDDDGWKKMQTQWKTFVKKAGIKTLLDSVNTRAHGPLKMRYFPKLSADDGEDTKKKKKKGKNKWDDKQQHWPYAPDATTRRAKGSALASFLGPGPSFTQKLSHYYALEVWMHLCGTINKWMGGKPNTIDNVRKITQDFAFWKYIAQLSGTSEEMLQWKKEIQKFEPSRAAAELKGEFLAPLKLKTKTIDGVTTVEQWPILIQTVIDSASEAVVDETKMPDLLRDDAAAEPEEEAERRRIEAEKQDIDKYIELHQRPTTQDELLALIETVKLYREDKGKMPTTSAELAELAETVQSMLSLGELSMRDDAWVEGEEEEDDDEGYEDDEDDDAPLDDYAADFDAAIATALAEQRDIGATRLAAAMEQVQVLETQGSIAAITAAAASVTIAAQAKTILQLNEKLTAALARAPPPSVNSTRRDSSPRGRRERRRRPLSPPPPTRHAGRLRAAQSAPAPDGGGFRGRPRPRRGRGPRSPSPPDMDTSALYDGPPEGTIEWDLSSLGSVEFEELSDMETL